MSGFDTIGDLLWSSSSDGLALIDEDRVVRANPRLLDWLGDAVLGLSLEQALPLTGARWSELLDGTRASATARVHAEQVARTCEVSIASADGGLQVLTVRDVSELTRLADELERRTRALEDSLNGYDIVDDRGRIVYANRAYVEMWGYDHVDEVVGMSAADHCADPQTPRLLIEAVMRDGRVTMEFEARRKDGSTFDVLMSVQRNVDAAGQVSFVGTSLDVTELRRMRRELTHAAKMEAVGRLAASVAHDFNNMLSPILGYAELLMADTSLASGHREAMEQVHTAGQRARSITSHLLSISRSKPLSPRPVDLNAAVSELQELLRLAVRENVSLRVQPSPSPCRVMADPVQLQQVLLNLFNNAVDAMPEGGAITIAVGRRDLDDHGSETQLGVTPGRYGEIVFSDTGLGMDRETLSKVFDAFFTTKGTLGHGLGLASVHGIVKQHGGNVFAYSELGRGTTFKIYLPLTDQPVRTEPPLAEVSLDVEERHVLLVENDELVRTVAVRILRQGGLQVSAAASAAEALTLAERIGAPDLLLTDVLLGDTNGRELATMLCQKFGELPVVFMSGYTEDVILRHGVLDPDVDLIEKPFSAAELLNRVRARL